ncbi:MAG: DUF2147 domain-containing protein [Paracoccaceae bacterium]|jgi:uncharacterized protein (DUF2147 family)
MRAFLLSSVATVMMIGSAAMAEPVLGLWQTQSGEDGGYAHVDVKPCDGKVCGTIIKTFEDDGSVSTTPEAKDVLGTVIIKDMVSHGDGTYSGGTIYAPDTEKTYNSKMAVTSDNVLQVKGCVLGGLICRGQEWTRVQ